jgi:hypothetical protein
MTFPGISRALAGAFLTLLMLLPDGPAADTATTPEAVVQNLVDAMQANDAERIRAAFAADASQAYGAGRPKSGDAFRAWLESDIIEPHGRVEEASIAVDGPSVTITGRYRNDNGYTSAADFLMVVEDGQIISWQMRY